MGSFSRRSADLRRHFEITEEAADEATRRMEACEIGDNLTDALFLLEKHGDRAGALAKLRQLHGELSAAITALSEATEPFPARNTKGS